MTNETVQDAFSTYWDKLYEEETTWSALDLTATILGGFGPILSELKGGIETPASFIPAFNEQLGDKVGNSVFLSIATASAVNF